MQVPVSTYNVSINFNALEKRIEPGSLSSRRFEKKTGRTKVTRKATRVYLSRARFLLRA